MNSTAGEVVSALSGSSIVEEWCSGITGATTSTSSSKSPVVKFPVLLLEHINHSRNFVYLLINIGNHFIIL